MITSYDKDKFEVGNIYWTFFVETTKKGNKLKHNTGIFKTKIIKSRPSMSGDYNYFEYDLFDLKVSKPLTKNLETYMNGYGTAWCEFYDTYEEAVKGYNEKLFYFSESICRDKANCILKYLIVEKGIKNEQ